MSQKLNENFDSKIAVDPFYSASNMAHLRRGIDALDAGNGVEHEIIEDESKAEHEIIEDESKAENDD